MKWRSLLPAALLSVSGIVGSTAPSPAHAITTPEIIASAVAPDCLEYRVVGVCVWLHCSWTGCSIRTSVKVRHYVPELVVSSYERPGSNPWREVSLLTSPLVDLAEGALGIAGGRATSDGTTQHRQSLRFKEADVIGHPGNEVFREMAGAFGLTCAGRSRAFEPYFSSPLDVLAWRSNIPEMAYPEALIPGRRELGQPGDNWGNIYPRGAFIGSRSHDYKVAALIAQRAVDIVTRTGQPHVYQPLAGGGRDGYWPPGPVVEGDGEHRWQHLSPNMTQQCVAWPDRSPSDTYADRLDPQGNYTFALWQRYRCCQRRGQTLLTHTGN
ncbi:TIGR03756 family integrating conjugative element protein [Billgrantia desiderata]|mgnify:CR=1 FL=1|uniref:TIGR03756 family integrating conjugative element protein n=1 Tax=Billgrantia desiderata TaxID=52021 RepID=UPI00089E9299|nr:TIGR03756 family integrating conjugative element protein [Halomonas desiderata]SEG30056.1 integrating conjugative element protein, PFL_4710 family [Halomonas desiderata]